METPPQTQTPQLVHVHKGRFLIIGIVLPIILGGSLIASSYIVSATFLNIKKLDNVITVSGSAKQRVVSDSAHWTGYYSRTVSKDQIKSGYTQMNQDEKTVRAFFLAQGFEQIEISPISMNEYTRNDALGTKDYNLTQNIEVRSADVLKIKSLAKNSEELAMNGVLFTPNQVEYYYSKLPELRVSMLPGAIKDAQARASIIAQNTGAIVGPAKSVTMGVVQVLSADSVDVSDYGSYDTSKIDKDVMVTVKAIFELK